MTDPLLEVEDLTVTYDVGDHSVTAVSDASFAIERGEFFGLVGESGCGKSTIAHALIGGLDDNGSIASGEIRYDGTPIQGYSDAELNEQLRWNEIAVIPQSSMNSLDPLMRVSEQAAMLARVHADMDKAAAVDRLGELFDIVGLQQSRIDDYPHQFSGGMQQRAIIAMALLLDPALIVADEPTTALDVIMQDQIFKYFDRIREEMDTSMVLITHDTGVVFESCDEMAIMHAGQVAETGTVEQLFDEPHHPYSIMLQQAVPRLDKTDSRLATIGGAPPQLVGDVDFCTFADRCPIATDECRRSAPELESVSGDAQRAACFRLKEARELDDQARPTGGETL